MILTYTTSDSMVTDEKTSSSYRVWAVVSNMQHARVVKINNCKILFIFFVLIVLGYNITDFILYQII